MSDQRQESTAPVELYFDRTPQPFGDGPADPRVYDASPRALCQTRYSRDPARCGGKVPALTPGGRVMRISRRRCFRSRSLELINWLRLEHLQRGDLDGGRLASPPAV